MSFYVFGYKQIELFVEIWQFFLNFGKILTIENLKKHLSLALFDF